MSVTKMRGFNRGKSYDDLRAIAGPTNLPVPATSGSTTVRAMGARWGAAEGGTLQRVGTSAAPSVYPAHATGLTNVYVEDLGDLQPLYASGGFTVTMYAARITPPWTYLYSPDGATIRSITTTTQYQDTQNFYDYAGAVNVPGATSTAITGHFSSYVNVSEETGELLYTYSNMRGRWDSAVNPTVSGSVTTSSNTYTSFTYHDGFYYWARSVGSSGGSVYRDTAWDGPGTAVYNVGSILTKVKWFPQANCFIATGNNSTSNPPIIGRSVDGLTWNTVYSLATASLSPRDIACSSDGQTLVVVGQNGFIVSSTDNGVTWAQRTSGAGSELFVTVTYFNGEFIAITALGNTSTSSDGLTWVYHANDTQAFAQDSNTEWRTMVANGKLYAFRLNTSNRYFIMEYAGSGQWYPIQALSVDSVAAGTRNIPTGIFFADPYSGSGLLTGGRFMYGAQMSTTGIYQWASGSTSLWSQYNQFTTAQDSNWHKIQIVCTAVPASATPTFTFRIWIDEVPAPGESTPFAAAAGQHLWFCNSGLGFNAFSDVIVTSFADVAPGNERPQGDLQLRPLRLTTDVQAQWTKDPASEPSNVEAVQGDGSVVSATSDVQSLAVGDTDQYGGLTALSEPGYKIAAVQVESTFQRLGIATPTVELNMLDNGVAESNPPTAVLSGSTSDYVTLTSLNEKRPDGGSWGFPDLANLSVQIKRSA